MVLVTALYAAILIIIYLYLSFNVAQTRMSKKIGLGDGEDEELKRAIRMHGNFSEYVPMILVLFIVLELNGTSDKVIHVLGSILIIARLLHVWGLSISSGESKPRFWGILLTWLVMGGSASLILMNFAGYVY